jgi:hypothetical protein
MKTRFHNPTKPNLEATPMTRAELQKENDELREELEDVKQQYNELRTSVLGTYELLSDNPLDTEGGDDEDDEEDE